MRPDTESFVAHSCHGIGVLGASIVISTDFVGHAKNQTWIDTQKAY